MWRSTLRIGLIFTLAIGLAGCSGTYVNIPPEPGDVASQNPNSSRVRELVTKSLKMVISDAGLQGPIELQMPDATTKLTHAAIADAVPQVIAPDAEDGPEPEAQMQVTGVRIRGTNGEVDVRRPRSAGSDVMQLVTAYSDWAPFSGWTVQRVRVWRGVADEG
jgi:hypothetical protein